MNTPLIAYHTSQSRTESMFINPNDIGLPNPQPDFQLVD
jgi:hypothetical protein